MKELEKYVNGGGQNSLLNSNSKDNIKLACALHTNLGMQKSQAFLRVFSLEAKYV